MLRVRNVPVEELKPWENNPRRNGQAVRALAKSIEEFGFNVPILCDEDMNVVAGHTRLKAAQRLGIKLVPVITLSLKGQDRRRFATADNKTGELADWDTPKLKEILDELRSEDLDLSNLGFSSRELRRLLKEENERENAIPEAPQRSRTASGTLWKLGRHRLLCGDSRCRKTFARLLGKEKVDHIFAGPPYFNQRPYSHWDDCAKYLRDIDAVIARCYAALNDGGIIVWNVGNGSSTHHAHVVHHAGLLEENRQEKYGSELA
ncbi:MAG TPA: ParB N-terminal domain-containing protein [Candidatus Hydrogenedentes bacterium]|nr:ParB N-terminal domain-containing protein [Candidatus Hydrogenedentota bacterium]